MVKFRKVGGWTAEGKKRISFHELMVRIALLRRAVKENYKRLSYAKRSHLIFSISESTRDAMGEEDDEKKQVR